MRRFLGRCKDSFEAYTRFEQGYTQSQFLSKALFGQGWALENLTRHKDAIAAYQRVIERGKFDESTARSQFQIGECLYALKDCDKAIKALMKVEVLYDWPEWSSKALLEAGRALEQLNKRKEARERYEELIKKYPASDAATVARQKAEALKDVKEEQNS